MSRVTVWLTESGRVWEVSFLHQIASEFRSRTDHSEGIVKTPSLLAHDASCGAFDITYDIQTDNGEMPTFRSLNWEKVKSTSKPT